MISARHAFWLPLLLCMAVVSAVPTASPSAAQAPTCADWYSPAGDEGVSPPLSLITTAEAFALRAPLDDIACRRGHTYPAGTSITVHAERGDFYYGVTPDGDWLWVTRAAFVAAHGGPPPGGTDAQVHLATLKATQYRNTNHDNSAFVSTPSASLPINDFLVTSEDYEAAGSLTRPTSTIGAFRVICEFSHFAYDDPIIFPGQPGAAHLHMFFGNTDANAFSTADSLLNSGSSTCNGQELNRTSYWVPALIDASGNLPVPDDALVYYKGYYSPYATPGDFEPYPDGMRFVSGDAMATAAQPGHGSFRELFFRCYHPGTGGGNPINTRSVTIPSCPTGSYLEMNVKFQTCWNGQDPADYKANASFSNVWPTSGACPASHSRKLPQLEYRIFYRTHAGSADWILSSDVSMADRTTINGHGYSLHGDWFGGWNREVNQRWIDDCVNVPNADCDEGLLADPRMNGVVDALRIRPEYDATMRVPGAQILNDLCPTKSYTGQASVALCNQVGVQEPPADPCGDGRPSLNGQADMFTLARDRTIRSGPSMACEEGARIPGATLLSVEGPFVRSDGLVWGFVHSESISGWMGLRQIDGGDDVLQALPPVEAPAGVYPTVTCLAGRGRVDVNVVNPGDAATYSLEVGALSPRVRRVAAGDWWRNPITGRPNGLLPVKLFRDGDLLLDTTVGVSCQSDYPVVTEPEVQLLNSCRDGDGFVAWQFSNPSILSRSYWIQFDGVPNRSTSAAAFGASVRGVSARPDGTYNFRILVDGAEIRRGSVTIACDPS